MTRDGLWAAGLHRVSTQPLNGNRVMAVVRCDFREWLLHHPPPPATGPANWAGPKPSTGIGICERTCWPRPCGFVRPLSLSLTHTVQRKICNFSGCSWANWAWSVLWPWPRARRRTIGALCHTVPGGLLGFLKHAPSPSSLPVSSPFFLSSLSRFRSSGRSKASGSGSFSSLPW